MSGTNSIREILKIGAHRNGFAKTIASNEQPLRSELFSVDQMEQHGKTLAKSHTVSTARASSQLLTRLAENESILVDTRDLLGEAITADRRITPAGEWLLDNFYLIEEQVRTAKKHFPKGYSRELPCLSKGASAGLPRVYDIALETISHGDGRLDPEGLRRFLRAYQTVTPLRLGELWAVPIMLRLALIENLRRVSLRIAADRMYRNRADYWADQMTEVAKTDPKNLILLIADMARSDVPIVSSFVAEFARRLQGQSAALALPLTWIEQQLSEQNLTIEQLIQSENQQQAADQVSISNSIGSLRLLGAMDWREFVETLSVVEQIFRQDAGGIYPRMDFATRDCYRHVAEKVAKSSPLSESEVALKAIELAQESAARNGAGDRTAHVGFYLIDKGLPQLEQAAERRHTILEKIAQFVRRKPLLFYLGAIVLLTAVFTGALVARVNSLHPPDWWLALIAVLSILCTSQLAVSLVNWVATLLAQPYSFPRMDFSRGIPSEFKTLVAIPTMLTDRDGVERLLEALEVRFLANRGENLFFGLLTDFPDANEKTEPEDAALLAEAKKGIDDLNEKYNDPGGNHFFLFHRPRRWNPEDQIWMGYERKRGKLADLNALLRGSGADHFALIAGDTSVLKNDVRYVITLDTDTQLPRDAAWQCVGAMAHPLNRPLYDEKKHRVIEGHDILQPRVAASFPGPHQSRYALWCGSEPGIDPYTRAVSDVYQDVFGEGSFIGKGIYEVDAFERALKNRFPENRILSHDLLEGCYARAGLDSDVQFYEADPVLYSADVSRRRRWIRGDWQIARWLFPAVPGPDGQRLDNPLSALSRWKIFDNLRRSLVPPAMILLFLLGWTILPLASFWTLTGLAILFTLPVLVTVLEIVRKPTDVSAIHHVVAIVRSGHRRLSQAAFGLVTLPYEAYFSLDAIIRTLWRIEVSHRHLLEWTPSSEAIRNRRTDLGASFRSMWIAPAIAISTACYLVAARPRVLGIAWPLLALWLVSPMIAWWMSRPLVRREPAVTADQTVFLRLLARRTWAFFEAFVGPEDHWLPPDNFQEQPVAVVAHRTSPTNIGLALLANLAAYDFGYLHGGELVERTAKSIATMQTLERHRGHFFNWYDTQSLRPLPPRYVSTVDSGNLTGHLLILRAGLLALIDQNVLGPRFFDGLNDAHQILLETAGENASDEIVRLKKCLESRPTTVTAIRQCLQDVVLRASSLGSANEWAAALVRQSDSALAELNLLLPAGAEEVPTLRELAAGGSQAAMERLSAIEHLADACGAMAQVEYDFLYDRTRHLLAIGYNVDDVRRDASYYDLLASEARLCDFVAIAQGQLPQESWFALGRLLASVDGEPILLSWSGSMFEYLMPLLIMPTFDNTLLDQTCKAVVKTQIAYGKKRGVPWGISESGYNQTDGRLNYQYRAFGVPGLGLKRGLADDLVIAPYASVMALMIAPEAATENLQRLAGDGLAGKYGLYEAIDYTSSRLPRGRSSAVIRSFMAHHQGMSLLSLAYFLLDRPMQKRFEADPAFQATTLLLQERIPKSTAFHPAPPELSDLRAGASAPETQIRIVTDPNSAVPEVQLLSNGRYQVMLTAAGGGYSRWKDLAVTRWREDTTRDNWGTFCYIRDVTSGMFWSTAYQPTLERSENYEAIFSDAKVEFRRRDFDYETHTEIAVSPEDDIELRRNKICNRTRIRRTIEVTSYAEVVLASPPADALHPAFSNLFVQTEIVSGRGAILCNRRPRSVHEHSPWMFHMLVAHGGEAGEISYETDRMQFIGRGNTVVKPEQMRGPLSGSQGSVLDPIVAIRCRITLDPGESVTVNIVTGMTDSRDLCLGLVEKYQDARLADRVFDLAWTHGQVVLRQLNATEADAQLYSRLASSVIYANPSLRADPSVLVKNRRGQSGLWGHAISGDLPIVLLQIGDRENIDLVRQMVQAHAYWRLKGLVVDLVIWNEDHAGYRQALQEQIMGLIAGGIEANVTDRPGGIFVRPADQMSIEDRILLLTVSRVVITDNAGTLTDQINGRITNDTIPPRLVASRTVRLDNPAPAAEAPHGDLIFFNGLGGFTPDGREYVITTRREQLTPSPWVNVLANANFGTVISESGSAYTWSENAHEFRLTPWANDPVSDPSGEAFYLRDEETGHFWSPAPLPCRGAGPYRSRHGFGYSVFEHIESGVASELSVYVALDAPVKFSVLKIRNDSGRVRRLSTTGYVEWVLGDLRPKTNMHVITEIDTASGALFARNRYSTEFANRVAFFSASDPRRIVSGDRTAFLGRNGTLSNPAAMAVSRLFGKIGAGLDPCAAVQIPFELGIGEEVEFVFTLGAGRDAEDASNLARRFRGSAAAHDALEAVWQYWKHTLGAVNVQSPDKSLNVLTNGWLLYQTLACRFWARSGYYQSGGAFGFRDQLQDAMALLHSEPRLLRNHLLLCAARQFREGDVQHWWHPPSGRGVRTHCSDDFLWLPLAVARYVVSTSDTGVLEEVIPFLEGRMVGAEEDSYYDLPGRSDETATLYEHCVRAILRGLRKGEHGLPLMGSGDWNDGMNLVGERGKGESVWLGFFICEVLAQFSEVARLRGDLAFVERCKTEGDQMRVSIEEQGWDGEWYRRAYFDDGTPLGSTANDECQIDSIPQSWSVLSEAGDPGRSRMAMEAVYKRLVRRDGQLIQLLDPPFDKSALNPGYIKGYVPGVRENGGQYTHAAIWTVMAFAALGDSRRAWELFSMINPVNHSSSPEAASVYKVEPYVAAADVYALSPHVGRGGWTWYTGSAGWMYRLITESILGLRLETDKLSIQPCLPTEWNNLTVHYRYRETVYHIAISQTTPEKPPSMMVDGVQHPGNTVTLVDDRREHSIELSLPMKTEVARIPDTLNNPAPVGKE
jgi:cyclic beta-1,2-glucan synthetase